MMMMKRLLGVSVIVPVSLALVLMMIGVGSAIVKTFPALAAPAESGGQGHNAEGVKHYDKDHWDVAADHFWEAAISDGNLAKPITIWPLLSTSLGSTVEPRNRSRKRWSWRRTIW